MPKAETAPAPANAPAMRAESEVTLEIPKAPMSWWEGWVCATSA